MKFSLVHAKQENVSYQSEHNNAKKCQINTINVQTDLTDFRLIVINCF